MDVYGHYSWIYIQNVYIMGKGTNKKGPKRDSLPTIATTQVVISEPTVSTKETADLDIMVVARNPMVNTKRGVVFPKTILPPESPTKPPTVSNGSQEGYILQHKMTESELTYTKVLHQKESGDWQIILLYKPTVKFPLYSKIEFNIGRHNGKDTVIDPVIVQQVTPLDNLMRYLTDEDVMEDTDIGSITEFEIAQKFLSVNHVGDSVNKKISNFLRSIGIHSIMGWVGNSIIYRKNKNNG